MSARAVYHSYVSEPHDTAPHPAAQYAHSCVTYTAWNNGLTDCYWIVPGSLEAAERGRLLVRSLKDRREALAKASA